MKKIIVIAFLLLAFSPLLKQNVAEAAIVNPGQMRTSASCAPSSTIVFKWDTLVQKGTNFSQYFWKTGDASETKMTPDNQDLAGGGGEYSWMVTLPNLPQGQTYDWHVRVHDDGFCLTDCDRTSNGPQVTSSTCNTSLPTCIYTYSNWSSCLSGVQTRTVVSKTPNPCNGDSKLTQGCTPQKIYDCANRSPECSNLTTYPTNRCFDYPVGSSWKCNKIPPDCAMNNRTGSDTSKWTNSCAFNAVQPPGSCKALNATDCTGGLAPDDCCPGSTCQPPRADRTALANGTCVATGADLGDVCYVCANASWSDSLNSCVDSSGKTTSYLSYLNCARDEFCQQGTGCIKAIPDCNIVDGCEKDGTYKLKCDSTGCDTAIGHIGTTPLAFIKGIFGVMLSLVGGIAVLLIIISGYRLATSRGNPEQVKGAQEQLTAAIIGLLFVIFSLVFLEVIGINIIGLPPSVFQ